MTLKTKKTTKLLSAVALIAMISIAFPGSQSAFAVKTYATHWFDPTASNARGISTFYAVQDATRTGWLADVTWVRSTLLADLLEIGWIDPNGSANPQYYCGQGGNIVRTWGSPSDGTTTTYYIYDPLNNGDFDLIGGLDSCSIDIGTYTFVKVETGYEDSTNSNTLDVNLHQNLKYYDGTWKNWSSSDGSHGKNESAGSGTVVYCSGTWAKSNHGDGAGSC